MLAASGALMIVLEAELMWPALYMVMGHRSGSSLQCQDRYQSWTGEVRH